MNTTNIFYNLLIKSTWRFVSIPCFCMAASVFLTGCGSLKYTGEADSNYSQVVRAHIRPACSGRAVVVTPDKQDAFVYSELPTTLGGIGYFSTPIGKVIHNRAEDVFSRVFSAAPHQNQSDVSETKYIVTPVYKKFTYGVDFSQVLTMVLDMEVIVKKEDGTTVYREQFHETGRVDLKTASNIGMTKDLGEAATFGIDKLVFNIMLKAANSTVVKIASTGTSPVAK